MEIGIAIFEGTGRKDVRVLRGWNWGEKAGDLVGTHISNWIKVTLAQLSDAKFTQILSISETVNENQKLLNYGLGKHLPILNLYIKLVPSIRDGLCE